MPRMNPAIVIDRKTACGNHAMDVWVQQQVLSPRVEDADHADLSAEMFLIGRQFQCRCSAGAEQQFVECSLVGQGQHVEFVRHGEDHVKIAGREKLLLSLGDPTFPRLSLTLRAVPVPAGVI